MMSSRAEHSLLEVNNLKTSFSTLRGQIAAVNGVSFSIGKGEIVGVVGESGCGKSVTSQSILRLYDEKKLVSYEGEILFHGKNLLALSEKEMEKIRGNRIAMIFQDALSSLNPLYTVGNQIAEAVIKHQKVSRSEGYKVAQEMLRLTGIPAPEERVHALPHELSGGMRQRAMIAMALACKPELLIADEPTTALDVTIQAQIMNLIVDLNRELGMGIMLITHDLGVVAQTCQRVIIMYLGHIVEEGSTEDIFDHPMHPYTMGLIQSIPTMTMDTSKKLYMIKGTVPPLGEAGDGCRFFGRCPYAADKCKNEEPRLEGEMGKQRARCHFAGQLTSENKGGHSV